MKNIHVLPTGKPSRLYYSGNNTDLLLSKELISFKTFERSPQDFYITNDEEIKEGDYCISYLNIIDEGKIHNSQTIFNPKTKEHLILLQSCKKIILTTDQDLIKDGVQAIDDEFLEWFIKNPSCEVVKIETFEVEDYIGFAGHTSYPTFHNEYKIFIPKYEPKQENCCTPLGQIKRYEDCYGCDRKPKQEKLTYTESAKKEERISNSIMMKRKQETIEEAAERIYPTPNPYVMGIDIGNMMRREAFKEGTKWMQERMYSEEEVINAFIEGQALTVRGKLIQGKEWFEQFKNK